MIKLTPKLINLYNLVSSNGPEIPIDLEIRKISDLDVLGVCTFKIENPTQPFIEILIREDAVNDTIISHELLHALNIKRGYGFSRHTGIGLLPYNHFIVLYHSVLEHKEIYDYQKESEIEVILNSKKSMDTIFCGEKNESMNISIETAINALILIEALICPENEGKELPERIKKDFPKTYELAMLLNDELFENTIRSAEDFRKVYIKGLRLIDKFIEDNNIFKRKLLKLTENITISYIPSERQLDLFVEQVFDFVVKNNVCVLISKKDKQASYVIRDLSQIKEIKKMTVEKLIGMFDVIISHRRA